MGFTKTQHAAHAKYCSKKCMFDDPEHLLHTRTCKKCREQFKSIGASHLCIACKSIICEYCSKRFTVKPYKIKSSKFCSTDCHDKSRMSHVWSHEDIQFIKTHYLNDMTVQEIADHYNVSIKSVYNAIEKHNIQRRVSFTKEKVLSEIRELYNRNISLSYTNMRKLKRGDLLTSAWHLLGS